MKIKKIINLIIKKTIYLFMWIMNKSFLFSKNKVLFISFGGKQYSDNPKYISEYLEANDNKAQIIWAFNSPKSKKQFLTKRITAIKIGSLSFFYHLATSKVWVNNFAMQHFIYKSNKQIYIQTWHGDRAFKKIMYDANPNLYGKTPLLETKHCDYFLTGSSFGEKMYRTAFQYNGDYLRYGLPRNDILFMDSQGKTKKIKEKLGLKLDDKILLFAPTFRQSDIDNESTQKITIQNIPNLIKTLNDVTEENWKILLRVHSLNSLGFEDIQLCDEVIDATSYEDMAELLFVADLLITDYSSSATDFILTNKPTILFQNDYLKYKKEDRDFYYDIKETNFLIAHDENDLHKKIKIALAENCLKRNTFIRTFYGVYENGKASYEVGEFIKKLIKN